MAQVSEANCKLLDHTDTGPSACHSALQILPPYLVFKVTGHWAAKSGTQLTNTKGEIREPGRGEKREELQREFL